MVLSYLSTSGNTRGQCCPDNVKVPPRNPFSLGTFTSENTEYSKDTQRWSEQ